MFGSRYWNRLPYDHRGLLAARDPDLRRLQALVSRRFWRRVPWPLRPFAIVAARVAWCIAAPLQARKRGRNWGAGPRARLTLAAACCITGMRPVEAWIWRFAFGNSALRSPSSGTMSAVLAALGDADQRAALTDKLATTELLRRAGAVGPALVATIARGSAVDLDDPLWRSGRALFVKPRRGAGGRGAIAVDADPTGPADLWRRPIPPDAFTEALDVDDLLVQERVAGHGALCDLAHMGQAPVLRITTAREPGAPPFIHSALLAIKVPHEHPQNFLRGHVYAAIDTERAVLLPGIWFADPRRRFERTWWNAAPIAGRPVPDLAAAMSRILAVAALLPGMPLISWDVIVSEQGPAILEGNAQGDWILTNFAEQCGIVTPALPPLLAKWKNALESIACMTTEPEGA